MKELWRRVRSACRVLWRSRQLDAEMQEEMRLHIAMEAERLVHEQGMGPREAHRQAHIRFGGLEKYKEQGRDERGRQWIDAISLDTRLGVRMLVKYRWLTLVGGFAMTVAIAIGAMFFEVMTEMLNPALPLEDGERVVALQYATAMPGSPERRVLHDFVAWRDELVSIEHLGAFRTAQHNLVSGNGPAEPIQVAEITASGFTVARTPPLLGRDRKTRDVAVRFDEAAPEEIVGIDVVHAERHQEAVPDHGEIVAPPGVGAPVNQPGAEIGRRHAGGKRQRNPPLPRVQLCREAEGQYCEDEKSGHNRHDREKTLPARQRIVRGQFHVVLTPGGQYAGEVSRSHAGSSLGPRRSPRLPAMSTKTATWPKGGPTAPGHLRPRGRPRFKDAKIQQQVDPRPRHQDRQALEELERREHQLGRAVAPRLPQRESHAPVVGSIGELGRHPAARTSAQRWPRVNLARPRSTLKQPATPCAAARGGPRPCSAGCGRDGGSDRPRPRRRPPARASTSRLPRTGPRTPSQQNPA